MDKSILDGLEAFIEKYFGKRGLVQLERTEIQQAVMFASIRRKRESQRQCCVWIVHNGCATLIILAACVIFWATYLVKG